MKQKPAIDASKSHIDIFRRRVSCSILGSTAGYCVEIPPAPSILDIGFSCGVVAV